MSELSRPSERTQTGSVEMIHVLCRRCGMSGTMVANDAARRAWTDHMLIHEDPEDFDAWTWAVTPLF